MGGIANQICGVRLSIAVVVLLAAGTAVQAQDLSVSPTGWDFGSVAVGTSETVTFNLLAGPPSPVWTYQVVLNETQDFDPPCANPYAWPEEDRTYSLGAFSFGAFTFPDAPGIPREMSVGLLQRLPRSPQQRFDPAAGDGGVLPADGQGCLGHDSRAWRTPADRGRHGSRRHGSPAFGVVVRALTHGRREDGAAGSFPGIFGTGGPAEIWYTAVL